MPTNYKERTDYPDWQQANNYMFIKPYTAIIDFIVTLVFIIETIFKILAEGFGPWRFFVGPEWKWNNFDFIIVALCLPGVPAGDYFPVALLRIARLMRLAKILKKVPQLQMIVMGLVGGLKSIAYIGILLLLVFYLFAIICIMLFRDNDPWHWHNLHTALVTLFRCATLEARARVSAFAANPPPPIFWRVF